MKLLCATLALLACLGSSLSQKCARVNSFSAVTFDPLNFVPSRSYHDVPNGYALYKNNGNSGVQLVDYNSGAIWERNTDGSCVKYASDDLKLKSKTAAELTAATTSILDFTDINGNTRYGVKLTNGNLVIRNLETSNCYGNFYSYTFGDALKYAYFFIDPVPLSAADAKEIINQRDQFVADGCTEQAI